MSEVHMQSDRRMQFMLFLRGVKELAGDKYPLMAAVRFSVPRPAAWRDLRGCLLAGGLALALLPSGAGQCDIPLACPAQDTRASIEADIRALCCIGQDCNTPTGLPETCRFEPVHSTVVEMSLRLRVLTACDCFSQPGLRCARPRVVGCVRGFHLRVPGLRRLPQPLRLVIPRCAPPLYHPRTIADHLCPACLPH